MPKISVPNFATAVIGGGGFNYYDRLLLDSTDHLLRPTAHMIGSANRVSTSFVSRDYQMHIKKQNGPDKRVR